MKTPTHAGMIEAARRVVPRAIWDCSSGATKHAFAIACDELLAKDAQIAELKARLELKRPGNVELHAELATAKAVLGEVHRLLGAYPYTKCSILAQARNLAAPYAVAVDPLVEALALAGCDRPKEIAAKLRERGITIPEAGQ